MHLEKPFYTIATTELAAIMILIVAFLFFTLAVAHILYELFRKGDDAALPPGPARIPLLGNMYSLIGRKRPSYEIVTELSKTYGDIMTFWIFNKPVVFLSSMRAIKEAYGDKKEISDRPATAAATLITGFFGLQDFTAKTQMIRNAFVQSIRSFWQSPLAEKEFVRVVEEVTDAMISAQSETKKPILMNEYITKMVYNTIMLLEFGKRFALDDPAFLRLIREGGLATRDVLRGIDICNVKLFLRDLVRLDHLSARFARTNEDGNTIGSCFKRLYEVVNAGVHKDVDIESVARALIKRFKEMDNGDETSIEQGIQIGDQDNVNTLLAMFFGAASSTITSINWLLLEMVLHPEIQETCYQELMQVTNGSPVTQRDRSRLPYIEACIMESLRFHPPVAFNMPRVSQSDVTIRNYKIPAGFGVVMNAWATQSDENSVKDTQHFNPENFLDDRGQFCRPQNLFLFGAGRRMCPGEVQAKVGIFLAFATMLGRMRFERVEKCQYDTVPDPAKVPKLAPKKYYVKISERKRRSDKA